MSELRTMLLDLQSENQRLRAGEKENKMMLNGGGLPPSG